MSIYQWISLIGAFGLGAIGGKIIDVIWLQDKIQERERNKWLREKRLNAYTELISVIRSEGLEPAQLNQANYLFKEKHIYELKRSCSKAILLLENDNLRERIDDYLTTMVKRREFAKELSEIPLEFDEIIECLNCPSKYSLSDTEISSTNECFERVKQIKEETEENNLSVNELNKQQEIIIDDLRREIIEK